MAENRCALMGQWWRNVPPEERQFIKQRQTEFPHLRPCPKTASAWWVPIENCSKCKHGVQTDAAEKESATPVAKGMTQKKNYDGDKYGRK